MRQLSRGFPAVGSPNENQGRSDTIWILMYFRRSRLQYHTQFYFLAIGMTWTLRFFQGTSDVKGDVGVSETELSRSEPNLTS